MNIHHSVYKCDIVYIFLCERSSKSKYISEKFNLKQNIAILISTASLVNLRDFNIALSEIKVLEIKKYHILRNFAEFTR